MSDAGHVRSPRFTVCPQAEGSACAVGYLPVGQADELQVRVKVGEFAASGEHVTLTATATGHQAISFHSAASVVVSMPAATPPPPPDTTPPTIPAASLPPIPDRGIAPTDPSSLFPTVAPTAGPASRGSVGRRQHHQRVRAATSSAVLPLDSRLIGGQLAGLAVLAGAVAIAITRLSLRTKRSHGSGGKPE